MFHATTNYLVSIRGHFINRKSSPPGNKRLNTDTERRTDGWTDGQTDVIVEIVMQILTHNIWTIEFVQTKGPPQAKN